MTVCVTVSCVQDPIVGALDGHHVSQYGDWAVDEDRILSLRIRVRLR